MDNLYTDTSDLNDSDMTKYTQLLTRMDAIDQALKKTKKKHKRNKKKGGKTKKLKRQMQALEMEYEQLKMFFQVFLMQMQMQTPSYLHTQQKPVWWQEAVTKSLPKLFDMGSVVLNNVTQKRPQILSAKIQRQLYLTDGSEK